MGTLLSVILLLFRLVVRLLTQGMGNLDSFLSTNRLYLVSETSSLSGGCYHQGDKMETALGA